MGVFGVSKRHRFSEALSRSGAPANGGESSGCSASSPTLAGSRLFHLRRCDGRKRYCIGVLILISPPTLRELSTLTFGYWPLIHILCEGPSLVF